jgi:hypothetical protein
MLNCARLPLAIAQFRERGPKGRGRISLSQDPTVSLPDRDLVAKQHLGR